MWKQFTQRPGKEKITFNQKFYEEISDAWLEPVLESLKTIHGMNEHHEIVNLIIPTLNDFMGDIKKMCRWIVENLEKDTPLHVTPFSPSYKMTHLPYTPINTLQEAHGIAKSEGIKYVYIGNVVGHPANSTYCPKCGKKLIERRHYIMLKNDIRNGSCQIGKENIPGIWS